MTDAEHAAVLRHLTRRSAPLIPSVAERAAIERAIEALGEIETLRQERDTARAALSTLMEIDDDAPLATAMKLLVRREADLNIARCHITELRWKLGLPDAD